MSVIIRLQNLPWTANARDIRNFFTGLSIPEGGVHIIGGENGDAFIAFSTDEDARVAMLKNCEKLMESQVRLLLSSRAEMQKVIESARTPVVAAAPVPVPVPVPMPVAAPQPPIIGGLNSFLSQSQSQSKPVGVPSFLDYQQQAGIVLAEVTGGRDIRRQSRSRSRSRSSSSEDSDRELRERERERERDRELERERERERDRAIRKRRQERADSAERELKLQSSSLSGIVAGGLSPWANPPQTAAAVSLPGLGIGMGLGLGLGLGVPPVLPSLQNYTTSNTTNNITNNYNMTNANGPSTPAPAPPLAPDAHKLIAALQAAARAGSNSPAQMEGQQQVLRQAVEQPVAFASVNPYAQIYPQLFQQQQQVLLQQQTAAKLSPSLGGSPGGGGSHSPRGGGGMSSAVADTCYVKISGLCQSTSYSDLRKYFQGLYIPHNGIKIMTVNGSRTGVAYIEFSRVSSAQKALQRHNTMFRDRLVQIVPIGDAEFEQAEEKSHRNQHQQQQPPQDIGGGRNVGNDRGSSMPSFNVLYVEDLPQLTTEQDIMKMFSATCTIVDILLAPSPNNRREFVAFVLFARESEALSALEDTSRHYIGFRQLRVRPSSQAEMLQAKEKQRRANEQLLKEEADQREELLQDQKRRQLAQAQLLLQQQREELAMQARFNNDPRRRADDNQNRDQQQQQMPQQTHMQPFVNTGPMANGMLPFVVQQQLQQLQQQQQQQNNGGGPNFPFNNNNNNNNNNMDIQNRNMNHNGGGGGSMDQSINRNHNGGGPFGGMPMPQNQNEGVRPPRQEDNFVRVHNCEYATRVNDLGELFSLENLRIEHIEMLLNDRNQSSGEFIVEFADGPNAKQAIREFHNRRFRGRGLRVVPITPQEIADRMNKPFMDYLPGGNGPRRTDNGGNSAQVSAQPTSRRRGPSRFDNNQQQQQAPPERQRQEDEDSNSSQKQHFNPFARPDPPAIASGSLSPALNVSNSSSSGSSIPDKFNRPGCVVAMTNVPFKAELKDILRFFSDYKLSPDDIIRRFNDDGKPTGDTRVAFESAAEARSAYETRRRKQIFTRSIHLEII